MTLQKLICIIKPDAVRKGYANAICERITKNNLRIVLSKEETLDNKTVRDFSHSFNQAPFYNKYIMHMISGPSITMILEGENALEIFSKLKGATDPKTALPKTLRADFGVDMTENAVHGSDTLESAEREINHFFPDAEEIGMVYVISGPSGVGKSTLIKKLTATVENLEKIVTYTTRQKRNNEIDTIDYHFVTDSVFDQMLKEEEFLERFESLGTRYGALKKSVTEKLKKGTDLVIDLDYMPAREVREAIPNCKCIYILPQSEQVLRDRLAERKEQQVDLRIEASKKSIPHYVEYDHVVFNDNIDDALLQLQSIIRAERTTLVFQEYKYVKSFQTMGLESTSYKFIMKTLGTIPETKKFLKNRAQIKLEILPGWNNTSYKIKYANDEYYLRIPRRGNDVISDRMNEKINLETVAKAGLYIKNIHFDQRSGVYLARFIQSHGVLTDELLQRDSTIISAVNILNQLHHLETPFKNHANPLVKAKLLLNELKNSKLTSYDEIFVIDEISELPEDFDYNIIIMQKSKSRLIAYWKENGKITNKSFEEKDVASILQALPNVGEKSQNKELIKNIITKFGCLVLVDMDKITETLDRICDAQKIALTVCPALVSCHNDVNPYNFLLTDNGVILGDWECSGLNDPFYDLANFSIECKFNSKQDAIMLQHYKHNLDIREAHARLTLNKPIVEFLLSMWLLYQIKIQNYVVSASVFATTFKNRFQNCLDMLNSHEYNDAHRYLKKPRVSAQMEIALLSPVSTAVVTTLGAATLVYGLSEILGLFSRKKQKSQSLRLQQASTNSIKKSAEHLRCKL